MSNDDRELLTKTQLRARRLKPAKDQQPVKRYWSHRARVYRDLYDPTEAVPMRPYRAPTDAQLKALAAGRAIQGTLVCTSCGTRSPRDLFISRRGQPICRLCDEQAEQLQLRRWADDLIAADALFLDTETTGLDAQAQIIEIALLDSTGAVLIDTFVKSVDPVPADATAIHGITDAMLVHAPLWEEVAAALTRFIAGKKVVCHNSWFDQEMLRQTSTRYRIDTPAPGSWHCTMTSLAKLNGGRWPNLAHAIELTGAAPPDGSPHRARYDAECCRRIVRALANNGREEAVWSADSSLRAT